jgi:predicted  nucleic acid-binding Zn-ribbon protein
MPPPTKETTQPEKGTGTTAKNLRFDDDYEDELDDLERLTHQYLALENKLYRVAKKMFATGKKLRRSTEHHAATIQNAAEGQNGKEKEALMKMMKQVHDSIDDLNALIEDAEHSAKREVAMMRKLVRALK